MSAATPRGPPAAVAEWKDIRRNLLRLDLALSDNDPKRRALGHELCRIDPIAFVHYVLRDERTGARVDLQPYHAQLIRELTGFQVDRPDLRKVLVTGSVECGKTNIAAICALWLLGRDPSLTIATFSSTAILAQNIATMMSKYIEPSPFEGHRAFHEVFPTILPGEPWSRRDGYRIQAPGFNRKDPSIRACGLDSGILSARLDILILDDILTRENTLTDHRRKETLGKIEDTLAGRVADDGRIWFLCNAWWENDAASVSASREGWTHYEMPVATGSIEAWQIYAHSGGAGPAPGMVHWPARWSVERVCRWIRQQPNSWKRALFCRRNRLVEGNRFRGAIEKALDVGRGMQLRSKVDSLPEGARIAIGADLAFSKVRDADKNALVPVLQAPDGVMAPIYLETDAPDARWTSHEFFSRCRDLDERYSDKRDPEYPRPPTFVVESVSAQLWIAEQAAAKGLHVEPCFTTFDKKHDADYGIDSMASDMMLGLLAIPCDENGEMHPLMAQLVEGLQLFDPTPGVHTADEVMSLWMAVRHLKMAIRGQHRSSSGIETLQEVAAEAQRVIDAGESPSVHRAGNFEDTSEMWEELKDIMDLGRDRW